MTEAKKQDAGPLGLASTAGLGLVERLRLHDDPRLYVEADELMAEAADEIERLREALSSAQEANRLLLPRAPRFPRTPRPPLPQPPREAMPGTGGMEWIGRLFRRKA